MNSERYDQVAALFRPDARLKAPGTEWVQGTAAVEGYYRAALGPYPDHRDEPTRTIIADAGAPAEGGGGAGDPAREGAPAGGKPPPGVRCRRRVRLRRRRPHHEAHLVVRL